MKIRKANLEDIDKLMPLWFQMHTSHYKYNKLFYNLKPKEEAFKAIHKHFEDFIRNEESFILVAEIDKKIVAYLKTKESTRPPVFPENQKIMLLDAAVVEENFRGRGIYKELQKELETEAQKRGAMYIELNVDVMNPAKNTYKNVGYEPRQIRMIKRVI